jgi:hypothetical protein
MEQSDVAESYSLGGNSYIVKPVNFEDFAPTMQLLGQYWMLLNQPPEPESLALDGTGDEQAKP